MDLIKQLTCEKATSLSSALADLIGSGHCCDRFWNSLQKICVALSHRPGFSHGSFKGACV